MYFFSKRDFECRSFHRRLSSPFGVSILSLAMLRFFTETYAEMCPTFVFQLYVPMFSMHPNSLSSERLFYLLNVVS